jgi:hypothetical protein
MLLAMAALLLPTAIAEAEPVEWDPIAPGLEIGAFRASAPSEVGDSRILIVRIDPGEWELTLVGRSATGDVSGRTAREWAQAHGLVVATNAGMFATDYVTHVGYMECRGHVNSRGVNRYQSVAAFHPRPGSGQPPFRLFDLDEPGVTLESIRESYESLVQNLRLIKRSAENRWGPQEKRWSEAALGEDEEGNALLVFSRSPFSMHDLNEELIAADIGLVALQHLEGGPEAQLYVGWGELELELAGSFETSFRENDGNAVAWPVPNVLGIRARSVDDASPSPAADGSEP